MRHRLNRIAIGTFRHLYLALFYGGTVGGVATLVTFVLVLDSRPDLKVWHVANLDEEFTTRSDVDTFGHYLALEERLFGQLQREVYDKVEGEDRHRINRYHRGSFADPERWPRNWNRSFELTQDDPQIGVLLIHGMSDSPYSMRSLGEHLHERGAWVTGLRVPGHGTAPVGLVDIDWQDMAAAVELAARHVKARLNGRPFFIVGYSNGGALAVNYSLSALEDASLPAADGLVLLSPEIGLTQLAALASWQERIGDLLGFEKLAWNSLQPEYDPFKYGSFAINAGKQAYQLTAHIQSRMTELEADQRLRDIPPILAFQSVVDSTVSAPAVVTGLFARLPPGDHELVLFDINRSAEVESLLTSDPTAWIDTTLHNDDLNFTVMLLTNENKRSTRIVGQRLRPEAGDLSECVLDVHWPPDVYSLSHVAPPFAPDDPLYGGPDAPESPGVKLGNLALRGERGALRIAPGDLLRLRWNPFYEHMLDRVLAFTGLANERLDCR